MNATRPAPLAPLPSTTAAMPTVIPLGGRWELRQDDGAEAIPATVPGCVHADLLAAGRIPDINWRDNETAIRWVENAEWTYERTVAVDAAFLARARAWLRCDGLDTLATVSVNGRVVLNADNMHRTWEVDVKSALKPGDNRISVRFAPVIPFMQAQIAKHRELPAWCVYLPEYRGKSYVRKMACSFGWDWGPMAPTAGIWRDIALFAADHGRLHDVRIEQQHADGKVTLVAHAHHDGPGRIRLIVDGVASDGATTTIAKPRLWWPNGLGEQHLTSVCVQLIEDGQVVDAWERAIGLRDLKLVQEADQWGESFAFAVNGLRIFAKGANWIPDDILPSRVTAERYADRVGSAAAAGMNMLRVWGGGIYEADAFYDACDHFGILVWQDFMYACATYPTFLPEFMDNCRAEAEDNIRRLRHHPCIALWCGNNELEQGLVADEWTATAMSWVDYARLFDVALPAIVRAEDPGAFYWPCSPHTNRGNRLDHNNPRCGDAHAWSVYFGGEDFESQRTWRYRFQSEFGFQSYPEPRTVAAFTAPADRNLTSRIMDFHQRSKSRGNKTIFTYLLDWFRMPKDFASSLWMSQLTQALCIVYAAEHTRRQQPRTEGCLYWQLNDMWPAPTWSSIDCFGRWKALQYLAKRFFAPVLVSGVEDVRAGTVAVHASNHRGAALTATARWRITDCAGAELAAGSAPVTVPAQGDARAAVVDCQALRQRLGRGDVAACERRTPDSASLGMYRGDSELLVWLSVEEGGVELSRNLVLFARPKHLELRDPGTTWTVAPAPGGGSAITVGTRHPALWLRLECGDARFSDNWFHSDGKTPVTVTTTADPDTVRRDLAITSLIEN
jgi:beta-mannosidase